MSVGNASARPASAQRGLLARHPLISFLSWPTPSPGLPGVHGCSPKRVLAYYHLS